MSNRLVNVNQNIQFAVYQHRMVTETNQVFTAKYIVLKNQYNAIIKFTELEIFAQPYTGRVPKNCDYSQEYHLVYICMALNYFVDSCGISDIQRISPEMVLDFLKAYTDSPQENGKARSLQSVSRCVSVVSNFFANLYLCAECFAPEALMQADFYKVNYKSERVIKKYAPIFRPKKESALSEPIFRDIPIDAMNTILEESKVWNKRIYFLILCQILTGLRPSEALNLRQEASPVGSSFKFTIINGEVTDIAIDLKNEFQMRADGKRVGGIKKHRVHHVFPDYIPLFVLGYNWHLNYLSTQKCDTTFGPLFPNKNGNAMTYATYRQAFQALLKTRVFPKLEMSDDPDVRVFAMRMKDENLSPHALRHFYTVNLVLKGLDIGQIQMYRGDKDPISALTYVNGKGEIIKKALKANEEANEGLMEIGRRALENGKQNN